MITIIILILAISVDAMSFGFAQGVKNVRIPIFNCLLMTFLSTFLFSLPLYLSKIIAQYFSVTICNFINGTVLICLGIIYFIKYLLNKNKTSYIEKPKEHINNLSIRLTILETFPISLDAIFTAFLNGYTLNFLLFGIVFYFIITFSSIFLFNKIGLFISKKTTTDLSFISSLIFIIIGILKICGI